MIPEYRTKSNSYILLSVPHTNTQNQTKQKKKNKTKILFWNNRPQNGIRDIVEAHR